jgi:predicted component of type VI protein secretion system
MRDWLHAIEIEPDPWARAAMRRSAGLESPLAAAVEPVAGVPTTVTTVAPPPPPGMGTAAIPLPSPAVVAATPPVAPAASPPSTQSSIDARALATRAIGRELDGDRFGAVQDLRSALTLEPDPARRASLESLLRLLEQPR